MTPERLRPCASPGCPELTSRSRCRIHQREVDREYKDPAKRKVYASRKWRGMRRTILKEHPWCQHCGINMATDIHHIVALEDGGDPYNKAGLQALCKRCHSRITAQETWGRKSLQ